MSFGLYFRPVPKEVPPAESLSVALKYKIAPRIWGHDGTIRGQVFLTRKDLPYLEGIRAGAGLNSEAGSGADHLIIAIKKHDAVSVWIGDPDDY